MALSQYENVEEMEKRTVSRTVIGQQVPLGWPSSRKWEENLEDKSLHKFRTTGLRTRKRCGSDHLQVIGIVIACDKSEEELAIVSSW